VVKIFAVSRSKSGIFDLNLNKNEPFSKVSTNCTSMDRPVEVGRFQSVKFMLCNTVTDRAEILVQKGEGLNRISPL
jgi:hypothetical protein